MQCNAWVRKNHDAVAIADTDAYCASHATVCHVLLKRLASNASSDVTTASTYMSSRFNTGPDREACVEPPPASPRLEAKSGGGPLG